MSAWDERPGAWNREANQRRRRGRRANDRVNGSIDSQGSSSGHCRFLKVEVVRFGGRADD